MLLKCFGNTSSSQKQYPTVIEELCHQFSLADIRKSTNNFDEDRIIGCGGFSNVYKGCLQPNDASDYTVAVKRFFVQYSEQVFKNEIELLCQLRHTNIISLIGFCIHKNEKILVFNHMTNGSLDQQLQRGELSWKKRLEICIGAARGLHYLHAGAKRTIIHRDICLANILLNDNMEPKLAGFGQSIKGPHFMSKPKPTPVPADHHFWGTSGYMAREYFKDHAVTDKYDVYSFGVVLLELVCGKKYFTMPREHVENLCEENIDPNIKGNIAPQCWRVFIDITQKCLMYEADERPTMGEVEMDLEHALLLQEQANITKHQQ